MRKKSQTLLGVAGALVLTATGAGVALAGNSEGGQLDQGYRHGTEVIRFEARPVHLEFLDHSTKGISAGDSHTFSNDMYQNGKKIGFDGGNCVNERVTEKEVIVNCQDVIKLPDGQITVAFIRVDPIGAPPSGKFSGAITGGTGKYRNARGELVVDPGNSQAHSTTIYLEKGRH
ncbi:hypothetical protein [Streptomyces sp. NPDC047928]|uniref:allene oxide cyclase barrel-like domain-containing protein n=1 Tax=unclassified Streptomyces TaxID=2593676 RepID=UPI003711596E